MRVLVTGASGHVGGAIANHLDSKGWEVIGLSRTRDQQVRVTTQIQADISSLSFLREVASETSPCDAIVHAAAAINRDLYASTVSLTNCFGTQQILELGKLWKINAFVYISSLQVIGKPQQFPITEEHPTNPLTAYHASKLYGEHLTNIARSGGLTSTILRLSSPIGPRMPDNRILSTFVKRAMLNKPLNIIGRGTRQQNYVDVRDVSLVVEQCINQRVQGLFNIGGICSISNYDLAHACVSVLGSSSPLKFTGDPDSEEGIIWEVSIGKAEKHFAYKPGYTIEESILTMGDLYANSIH